MVKRQIFKDPYVPAVETCLNYIDTIPASVHLERANRL
jgi:hypothetical protein